jgi:hypothetical protein
MPAAEYVTSIWISMKAEYVYPGDRVLESGTSASPVRWPLAATNLFLEQMSKVKNALSNTTYQ